MTLPDDAGSIDIRGANQLEVDFLILADGAQVQNEKLFLLGGGWTFIRVQTFPATHPMSAALGILIPWLKTNERHKFRVEIRNEDTKSVAVGVEGEFEQGRPPGTPAGMTQRVMMAFNFGLQIDAPAQFIAEASVNGIVLKTLPFRAIAAAQRP
jgi:hypothetical protein